MKAKGLGIQFLRHIERTKILAILLDSSSESMEKDYITLMHELESYSADLMRKRRLLIYTKIDLIQGKPKRLKAKLSGIVPVHSISAVRGDGLDTLIRLVWDELQQVD